MKKYSILLLSIVFLLNACKKDDYAFDQTPDERIKAALSSFQSALLSAPDGWKAFVTVDSGRGGTYSLYFKFNDANRVVMVSDFDSASAATPEESSYRLKAQQQPTLIFDTYSYLHVLADPNESVAIGLDGSLNENVNGGQVGEGLLSDFEFIIDKEQVQADTIRMNGKVHGAKLVMIKATKAESDVYLNGQFTLYSTFFSDKILTYFKRLTVGSQLYDISVNTLNRVISFTWVDASGTPHFYSSNYYNVIGGIAFTDPLVNGSTTITGITNVTYDPTGSGSITGQVGGQTATVTPIVVPLYVDRTAPSRWWQLGFDNDAYWYSWDGFHVNGVDDGFGINTLPSFYYLIYWPEYGTGNDLFAPVFINAAGTALQLNYGAAPRKPTVTADGRGVFTLLGNYGTYPATGPARLSRDQLLIPEGFYFVQISDSEYDMVSAKDGLAWIRWTFIL